MNRIRLPSLDVPEHEKRAYTEAEVHSKLFERDMQALGFPRRTNSQADGEYFQEQRTLAARRLKSGSQRGFFDGLYLIGNSPIVLCELKAYEAIDTESEFNRAVAQLHGYAQSGDFEVPPPFLLLYCGKPEHTRFYARRQMVDVSASNELAYDEVPDIWEWERIRAAHLRGSFAEEIVDAARLRQILLHHLGQIEDDLRTQVKGAVELVASDEPPGLMNDFQRWLEGNPEAKGAMKALYERKVAEIGQTDRNAVAEEMVTQAALNYLNKVFFLNLCEDRNLPGFYRIMREFLPETRTQTTPAAATVFLGMLRRRILDSARVWDPEEQRVYRELRAELASDIREHVITQNNWWELIRVAFDLARERFEVVYREDAYDLFRPGKEALAELIYDLSTKSFEALTNQNVGDIYQSLLASRRGGTRQPGTRTQRAKLGAFYTPKPDVEYMVSRLGLAKDAKVLDPCMGSGHFLEGIYEHLAELYRAEGHEPAAAYRQIVSEQLYGADIDTFAASLSAIRLFLLDEHDVRVEPNLFVHDMLLHSPQRTLELFPGGNSVTTPDPERDMAAPIDAIEFDAVVGNPPYGARKPAYKKDAYARLYGMRTRDRRAGSIATGDADTYAMFFANGVERLREGGRLCLITNDSFRSLTTHAALRRHILDTCKIVEILLTDTKHFEGVSFAFAGMAITTLEKCSNVEARGANEIRLVDYIRNPAQFADAPDEKISTLRQEEYEALPETPFFVGVPREVFEAAKGSETVAEYAKGRVGLQTGDDRRFLAGIGDRYQGVDHLVATSDLATGVEPDQQRRGIGVSERHWVPFAKGGGFGEYWRDADIAIDWSRESVRELERRGTLPSGTPRRTYWRNREFYFKPGLTYSVISSGRISVRLMPAGWVFGHKGSAIFAEHEGTNELFLLGYLNSALATYFMKRIVNTTATADIGYIEKLPYRHPSPEIEQLVVDRVERIIIALKSDPEAEIASLRAEIDEAIFDLFEIRSTRDEVLRFYENVGLAERTGEDVEAIEVQAASE